MFRRMGDERRRCLPGGRSSARGCGAGDRAPRWPTWQSDISAAQLDGAFAPVESFTWTSFGFTVTSTVCAVPETTESFAGAPVEADVAGMQQLLDGSLGSWLSHLKNAAQAANPA
jgi:hypothetical protein